MAVALDLTVTLASHGADRRKDQEMGAANWHETIAEAARVGLLAAACERAHRAAATVIAG